MGAALRSPVPGAGRAFGSCERVASHDCVQVQPARVHSVLIEAQASSESSSGRAARAAPGGLVGSAGRAGRGWQRAQGCQ
eukprot:15391273-Alexandrium_andersonii.AAC.1